MSSLVHSTDDHQDPLTCVSAKGKWRTTLPISSCVVGHTRVFECYVILTVFIVETFNVLGVCCQVGAPRLQQMGILLLPRDSLCRTAQSIKGFVRSIAA